MSREAQLLERIAELEEENRYLRQLVVPVDALPASWGLQPKQTRLVLTLARAQGWVHKDRLRAALGKIKRDVDDRYVEVCLHHTRRKLKPLGVEILTERYVGLNMPRDSRAIVLAALDAVMTGQVA
ncbi:helix-turn-helix domain-containing protein [Methylobacterium flocculans]|uniref:helix-turn-helix domain-containing protein n=1 Tax=Methylobacterium flocculans TaxID=2984843 RepID=UPI0021F25CE0|nr:helix-turn-helix domain-containing protein [Methylobacterium sp. FF17]